MNLENENQMELYEQVLYPTNRDKNTHVFYDEEIVNIQNRKSIKLF